MRERKKAGLPRIRGDRPISKPIGAKKKKATPHTRGSTLELADGTKLTNGYPAYAGIDLLKGFAQLAVDGLPRIRGDRPPPTGQLASPKPATPHTRGSTHAVFILNKISYGYPAYAGIDLFPQQGKGGNSRLPRIRGDRPYRRDQCANGIPATPHTRGSTPVHMRRLYRGIGYPAYAGIDRTPAGLGTTLRRLPRIRGDRPLEDRREAKKREATPHTRGSTSSSFFQTSRQRGYPAYAGIDLPWELFVVALVRLPRIRGDRPSKGVSLAKRTKATPHTRGSTCLTNGEITREYGYPAYAGIDLLAPVTTEPASWLPRIRGDRPHHQTPGAQPWPATPHTRGSTVSR